jgi:glutamate synthase domain-containing protein 2
MSSDILPELRSLLEKNRVVNRLSFFQMKYFLIGKEPTIQARLRLCLNEISSRKESLEHLALAIDDQNDELRLKELEIEQAGVELTENELNKECQEIKIRKLGRKKKQAELNLQSLYKTLRETEEEAQFFLEAFKALEKAESLKPFDDYESNLRVWDERYREEVHLRLLTQKPLDLQLMKSILALDKEAPVRKELTDMMLQIETQAKKYKKLLKDKKEDICPSESQV